MKPPILSALFLLMCVLTIAQDNPLVFAKNEWRGLIPLKSTRSAVEEILNEPLRKDCSDCIYETASERVFVSYSKGICEGGAVNGWNVPKGTVISFTVYPRDGQKFSAGDFKDDSPLYYSHDSFILQRKGVAYTLDPLAISIVRISFLPSESDNHLRCAGFPAYNPVGSIYAPDAAFGEKDAFANLDVLVAESKGSPVGTTTYVIVYAGDKMSEQSYAKLLKKYEVHLYKKRSASRDRIRIVRGGKRDRFSISVYNLAKNMPPPVPSPDHPY